MNESDRFVRNQLLHHAQDLLEYMEERSDYRERSENQDKPWFSDRERSENQDKPQNLHTKRLRRATALLRREHSPGSWPRVRDHVADELQQLFSHEAAGANCEEELTSIYKRFLRVRGLSSGRESHTEAGSGGEA